MLTFVGILVGYVAGGIYGVISHVNPYFYFTVIAAIGAGLAVGYSVRTVADWLELGSRRAVIVVGCISTVALIYANWSLWAVALTGWHFEILPVNPIGLWDFICEVSKEGTWGFTSVDNQVSGGPLWFLWGIETVFLSGAMWHQLKEYWEG